MYDERFGVFNDDFISNNITKNTVVTIVTPDVHLLMLITAFTIPYVAFLMVLPGIKEHRFASFITITITFSIGFITLGAILHPSWNMGSAKVVSQFHAHSPQRVQAFIGAHIGLSSLNITMSQISSIEPSEKRRFEGVHFNEKFDISSVGSMGEELQLAYRKGLPYPMLKLLEYFSLNEGSFDWGRKYRLAGHYAGASLWMGFALWMIQVVILCAAPHNYSKVAIASGIFTLVGVIVYAYLCPRQLRIFFTAADGNVALLEMRYGLCFYAALIAGLLNTLFGGVLCILQFAKIYALSTFLDASIDEHVVPSCSKNSNSKKSLKLPVDVSSLNFMMTMKSLHCVEAGEPSSCSNFISSGFHSQRSSSISSYQLNNSSSPDEQAMMRRSCSQATIETLSRTSPIIIDRF